MKNKKKNVIETIKDDIVAGNIGHGNVADVQPIGAEVEVATDATVAIAGDEAAKSATEDTTIAFDTIRGAAGLDPAAVGSPAITSWANYVENPEEYEKNIEIDDMFDESGGRKFISKETFANVEYVIDDIIAEVLRVVGDKGGDVRAVRTKRTARSAEMTPPEEKTLERKKAGRSKSKGGRSKSRARKQPVFNFSKLDDTNDFVEEEAVVKKQMYKSVEEKKILGAAGTSKFKKK